MLVSMIAAMAMAQAIQTNAYQMEIVITENGHAYLTTRSQIAIDQPSHVRVGHIELNAKLYTVQGDGDASTLQLESSVTRNGDAVVEPNFTVLRGQPFYFQVSEGGETVRITLTPLDE